MAAAEIERNKVIKWYVQYVCNGFGVDSVLKYPVCCLICPEKLKIELSFWEFMYIIVPLLANIHRVS